QDVRAVLAVVRVDAHHTHCVTGLLLLDAMREQLSRLPAAYQRVAGGEGDGAIAAPLRDAVEVLAYRGDGSGRGVGSRGQGYARGGQRDREQACTQAHRHLAIDEILHSPPTLIPFTVTFQPPSTPSIVLPEASTHTWAELESAAPSSRFRPSS